MFAASAQSRVFHLIEPNDHRIFCGLSVSPFVSEKPRGERVHIVKFRPPERLECKHCKRLQLGAGYPKAP
ncbi:MAG: hypothetical protein QOE77_1693 [Blastocatellia bacterium]|jgi:hypothetical protein|nr:hypothetical protein [Blastocatellia bacterium]